MRRSGGASIWVHPVASKWNDEIKAVAAEQTQPEQPIDLQVSVIQLDLSGADEKPVRHRLVRHLQGLLAAAGSLDPVTDKIDGSAEAGTKAAVLKFQKAKGLAEDAIVGPRTWAALMP
jgi:peptidoglycan hydrolase-like protein with peptidoglycan-binding domain